MQERLESAEQTYSQRTAELEHITSELEEYNQRMEAQSIDMEAMQAQMVANRKREASIAQRLVAANEAQRRARDNMSVRLRSLSTQSILIYTVKACFACHSERGGRR